MELPDLTNLPLASLVGFALLLAALDVIGTVGIAVAAGNFKAEFVADFLRSHVLMRVLPVLLLGAAGHGIPSFDIPAIPAASLAASLALAAYGVAVLGSIRGSIKDKGVVLP